MKISDSKLTDKVKILDISTDKFITSRIEISFLVPMSKETVAEYSLLPAYLTRTTMKYNTPQKLSQKQAELYGASISASVSKKGDNLELTISLSGLKNSLALYGEDIFAELQDLLYEIALNPNKDGDKFIKAYVEGEKRIAIEQIEAEINNKRRYAVKKTIEIMCENECFGNSKYGSKEDVEKIDEVSLYNAYLRLLNNAKIKLSVSSETEIDKNKKLFTSLSGLGNNSVELNETVLKPAREEYVEFSEALDVTQGKLVLGFRGKDKISVRNSVKYKIMADVFGGGPYSLLFLNVREAQSLCYYCATSYERNKQLLIVDSGVEFDNIEKTKEEILKYFNIMQSGEFPVETLKASKKSLKEIYRAISDSADTLAAWYAGQLDEEEQISPEEFARLIDQVSYEDVTNAANGFSVDVIFSIKGL